MYALRMYSRYSEQCIDSNSEALLEGIECMLSESSVEVCNNVFTATSGALLERHCMDSLIADSQEHSTHLKRSINCCKPSRCHLFLKTQRLQTLLTEGESKQTQSALSSTRLVAITRDQAVTITQWGYREDLMRDLRDRTAYRQFRE
jgi:hypothetical protein